MSQKFQASVQQRGDVSYVKLGGVIDEDNELSDLVDKIPAGTALIDVGEIERINSCGVRDWVNWLGKLDGQGARSVLVECSPAIVAQINLVNNFTGNGVVKSFYVPYFCPECDEEKVLLVETAEMGPAPHEPPTCRCDECDLVMDFDDMPDSYFAFLANQRKLPTEKISETMRDFGGQGDKHKVRSRASVPNLSSTKPPSVPSLPSIQQRASAPASGPYVQAHGSAPGRGVKPPSRPMMPNPAKAGGSRPPNGMVSGPNLMSSGPHVPGSSFTFATAPSPAPMQAPKSSALVYVLIAVLLGAIGVLAYLVLTK